MNTRQKKEVDRFLRTGDSDLLHKVWDGDVLERIHQGEDVLRRALVREVRRRAGRKRPKQIPADIDLRHFARSKASAMVRGLFPFAEQEAVLGMLEKSVIFLTATEYARILRSTRWLNTAWTLGNLYLESVGAPLLSRNATRLVGMSEETTCYVSANYFSEENPFADFVLHEMAHIFHNCKVDTVGLRRTRRRQWLLDLDFGKRETFAYACEVYGRIVERGACPADRRRLFAEHERRPFHIKDCEDREYLDMVREAVGARNGWKRILARCARPRTRTVATAG